MFRMPRSAASGTRRDRRAVEAYERAFPAERASSPIEPAQPAAFAALTAAQFELLVLRSAVEAAPAPAPGRRARRGGERRRRREGATGEQRAAAAASAGAMLAMTMGVPFSALEASGYWAALRSGDR